MADAPYVEVVTAERLDQRVRQLGAAISKDYSGLDPVLVCVLKGSVVFMADLARAIDIPVEVDFLGLTRFGSGGRVAIDMDTTVSLQGRHVIVVEDIVDTGLTLTAMQRLLDAREPASIATVTLLDKVTRRLVDVPLRYRGFEVGDEFLLGYGLDWEGRYRNVRSIWAVMDLEPLTADPLHFAPVGYAVS